MTTITDKDNVKDIKRLLNEGFKYAIVATRFYSEYRETRYENCRACTTTTKATAERCIVAYFKSKQEAEEESETYPRTRPNKIQYLTKYPTVISLAEYLEYLSK